MNKWEKEEIRHDLIAEIKYRCPLCESFSDFESNFCPNCGEKMKSGTYETVEHELKILPPYYEEVKAGNKTFELRKNDRNYKVQDTIILRAWENGQYLNEEPIKKTIKYVLKDCPEYGLMKGYAILGF